MKKTLCHIIICAFTIGLVAMTATNIYALAHGGSVATDTAIELILCWGVVLATFVLTLFGMVANPGALMGMMVSIQRRPEPEPDEHNPPESDDGNPEETPEETAGEDGDGSDETPEETPAETPEETPEENRQ